MTLVRVDENLKKMTKSTPRTEQTSHFLCQACGVVYLALMTDKPLLIEQVVRS